jgi:hypothetical protein
MEFRWVETESADAVPKLFSPYHSLVLADLAFS